MKKIAKTGMRWSGALLFIACLVNCIFVEVRSPSAFVADTIRKALKEKDGATPKVSAIPRSENAVRDVVSRNLDALLLNTAQGVSGSDYRYQFSETGRSEQIGVIVLQYGNEPEAMRMNSILAPRKKYFRNTKILTRFSAVALGALLVVTYSENSGDDRMVAAIDKLGSEFARASDANVQWRQSMNLQIK